MVYAATDTNSTWEGDSGGPCFVISRDKKKLWLLGVNLGHVGFLARKVGRAVGEGGEVGTIASPATVVNAVVDALAPFGIVHLDMPTTPERVWQALGAAKGDYTGHIDEQIDGPQLRLGARQRYQAQPGRVNIRQTLAVQPQLARAAVQDQP